MVTRQCAVQRAAYSFTTMRPVQMPQMINGKLGSQNAMEQVVNQVSANHHELRVWDSNNFEMYCIYCGEVETQAYWQSIFRTEQKNAGS